ncbi:hypothetical protein KIH39_10800 [Telmatocola sphagniphila]|uniref:Lipoprotein n=1 Tax=Telmatocola sphagniphila TaxID=1123043 RepID=A0A8E6B9S8_9BACT|nr:hypothetical protein [Telmatocola sphagniphila]QVL34366.1 hypothetical protein KIH39_10800 [Telmatocola sphagniphila]
MEPLVKLKSMDRRTACLALAAVPLWMTGCLSAPKTEKAAQASTSTSEYKKPSEDGRMTATWSNRITLAPDPLSGGTLNVGLLGRVYLFKNGYGVPYVSEGLLVIDLFDHTPNPGNPEPRHLEQWRFDETVLPKFEKKDFVGPGYSMYLPWSTYTPDMSKILLQARWCSKDGKSVYFTQSDLITLDHTAVKEYANSHHALPSTGAKPELIDSKNAVVKTNSKS